MVSLAGKQLDGRGEYPPAGVFLVSNLFLSCLGGTTG